MMKYQPLGTLTSSRLGFGCWQLGGSHWGKVDPKECMKAVSLAVDLGINLFDTAPLYGAGKADQRLLEALGEKRHDVIIATKAGVERKGKQARSLLSSAHLKRDIEASLKRLKIDSIPLLQIHWPCDQQTPLEETFSTLARMREKGVIQNIGVCNYSAVELLEMQKYAPIVSTQHAYSMLRRECEAELIPFLQKQGIAAIAYEVLCRGLLSGKYRIAPQFPRSDLRAHDPRFQGRMFQQHQLLIHNLSTAARKLQISMPAIPIAWSLKRMNFALVGIKNREQLLENHKAMALLHKPKALHIIDQILQWIHK